MEAVRYDPELHAEQVASWATARGLTPIPPEYLPKIGRIVPGKAVIFLYQTDSKMAFAENLLANPDNTSDPKVKQDISEAIDTCVRALWEDAKEAGAELIVGYAHISALKARYERLDCVVFEEKYHRFGRRL
jgi:hypothetical protein